ncbi:MULTISPECIES: tail fiber assembly protein [Enterobacteriaceae]|jgi:hypothetical protein|uniref:tail fiber assembly protein n=1 Tax=Enterobacteriaceae TaxID=543 RepID=UPI000975D6BE|nr:MULTISPECIES: tail fiber assembly protein [Enterobacteriaceae]NEY17431.1 tail fiber assembly protein [Escherichia coli]HAW0902666.1 tail fiber assembly protein [Escherichia coli]
MKIFCCLNTIGFFPEGNLGMPEGAQEISADTWNALLIAQQEGCEIDFSVFPPVAKEPVRTHEDDVNDAELKKQYLLDQTNEYINGRQWPGKAAMGRLSEDERAQYNLWLDYLDALEAVDTSSAPNISWPSQPEA